MAESTLQAIPRDALAAFLAGGDASAEMRAFFAARGIEPAASPNPADDCSARRWRRARRRP